MQEILIVVQCVIVLLLVIAVFLQKSNADSLSGLSGGVHNSMGHKVASSGDTLNKTIVVLTALFLLNSLIMAKMEISKKQENTGVIRSIQMESANGSSKIHAPAGE
jgi:protein translocase SecG subunit